MLAVEDALKSILDSVNILPSEEINLIDSLYRVLAEDIYSNCDIPLLNNSAMDGYVLKAVDTKGASKIAPRTLQVIGDLKAGYVSEETVRDNQAMRIMTGAPIPKGADSVIIVEETEKQDKAKVRIFKEVKPGENIRKAGEDIKKGEKVLLKGIVLNPARVGMLASLGKATIRVTRKPRVAVLATGDEVIDVDETLEPGKLRNSNTYTLYSQILECGGIPVNLGIAKDKPGELEDKLKQGLDCDLIVTSGGVSVGDYDLVKFILAKMGTDIRFWKVSMRPGKPLVFGRLDRCLIFGLPGNPVSSMISFEVFVRPAISKMLSQGSDPRKEVDAVLEEDIKKKKGLMYFLRAQTKWDDGMYFTRTTGPQGSGILKSMALANSLIVLPEEEDCIQKGTRVTVRFLD